MTHNTVYIYIYVYIYNQYTIFIAWKFKSDIIFNTNTAIKYLIIKWKELDFIWNEQEYVDRLL